MPNVTQIMNGITKDYVELPDGTFAEKVVIVNPNGTGIAGASTSSVGIVQISDSINKFFVKLPNGTFAERKVAVNADGTALGA